MKKLTHKEFIKKVINFNNLKNYTFQSEYKNQRSKISYTCSRGHKDIKTASLLLNGAGCKKCSDLKNSIHFAGGFKEETFEEYDKMVKASENKFVKNTPINVLRDFYYNNLTNTDKAMFYNFSYDELLKFKLNISDRWTNNSEFYKNNIKLLTSKISFEVKNIQEAFYCIKNELKENPKCNCGKELKFQNQSYKQFCSWKCQRLSLNSVKEIKTSSLTNKELKLYINSLNENNINLQNRKLAEVYGSIPLVAKKGSQKEIQKNIYCFMNDVKEIPLCKCGCKKETALFSHKDGFKMFYNQVHKKRFHSVYRNEFIDYSTKCRNITRNVNVSNLPNIEKRGRKYYEGSFQLDHKFSISVGFIDNIPPFIIGSICNLEMIEALENAKKHKKCSISKEQLLKDFYGNN